MSTYEVLVTRENKWWMIYIPALEGLTQARRLNKVESMAREFIAVSTDAPLSSIDISMSIGAVDDISDLEARVKSILRARADAAALDREATQNSVELAQSLHGRGIPLRDIGSILQLSYQRVGQLINM